MSSSSFQVTASRHFTQWMIDQRVSLAISTYQAGKLLLVGCKPDGRLAVCERNFPRCLGLWSDGQTLWMSSQFQLWRFENVLTCPDTREGVDRLFVPRVGITTGELDIHDIGMNSDGQPVFVNTLFGCLATVDPRFSFRPLWRPRFVSRLVAEDRCHLNGVAFEFAGEKRQAIVESTRPAGLTVDAATQVGRPRFVTACSQSDVIDGWRDQRTHGGCVVDVVSNEVVATGLSMPHSPRLSAGVGQDKLWLLDSGHGYLGYISLANGRLERVAFCPGYARGLALRGDFAVIGLSRPREATFQGLPLETELSRRGTVARTGLHVVDLSSGEVAHWLRIEGAITELYDVVLLPHVARPQALGFKTDEIRRQIWFEQDGQVRGWTGMNRENSPSSATDSE
jgi:hypothetical protein